MTARQLPAVWLPRAEAGSPATGWLAKPAGSVGRPADRTDVAVPGTLVVCSRAALEQAGRPYGPGVRQPDGQLANARLPVSQLGACELANSRPPS